MTNAIGELRSVRCAALKRDGNARHNDANVHGVAICSATAGAALVLLMSATPANEIVKFEFMHTHTYRDVFVRRASDSSKSASSFDVD